MRISSTEGRQKQIMGPYNDASISRAQEYAQARSQREGTTIEAFWVCGRRRPMLLSVHKSGKMTYPKSSAGIRQLDNVSSCMSKPSSMVKSSERAPREVTSRFLSGARKLPGRFACPARIVSAENPPEFQGDPRAVKPVNGEQEVGDGLGSYVEAPPFPPPIEPPLTRENVLPPFTGPQGALGRGFGPGFPYPER
jgi:hypothetical protein